MRKKFLLGSILSLAVYSGLGQAESEGVDHKKGFWFYGMLNGGAGFNPSSNSTNLIPYQADLTLGPTYFFGKH